MSSGSLNCMTKQDLSEHTLHGKRKSHFMIGSGIFQSKGTAGAKSLKWQSVRHVKKWKGQCAQGATARK